jgi:bacillithiol biosynthesis deacetylase BshB1
MHGPRPYLSGVTTPSHDLDVLAIAAHRDDVELTCGGTLAGLRRKGRRTGILDLTQGEMGTRGSAETRAAEAAAAAKVLGVEVRENLGLPDAGITNTPETRAQLAQVLRRLRPAIVIAPAPRGRHPDHRVAAQLIRDAVFVAGLAKVAPGTPAYRPRKVIHAIAYREDNVKPTFVVDISDDFETKLNAIRCYGSQFDGALQAGEVYPTGDPFYHVLRHQASHYGSLIRCRFGEPFWTSETMRVDDISTLEVSTF